MANTQEGLEWGAAYVLDNCDVAGDGLWTATTTNTYTAGCTIAVTSAVLLAVAVSDIGVTDLGIIVTGSNATGSASAWAGVISANACIDYGFKLVSACALTIAFITSVATSGGTSGDHFELLAVPGASARTNLEFIRNLRDDSGTTFRNVPKGYVATDHTKRIRGNQTLSFEGIRQTGQTGLCSLRNRRNFTIIMTRDTDGDGTITESLVFEQVSGSISSSNPIGNSGEVTDSFTGTCKRGISVIASV